MEPFMELSRRSRSGERGNRVGTGFRGEGVAEVGVERAALQPAGLIDGEQPFDRAFATLGAAAERELAIDDGGAQAALGGVVGRLDIGHVGERPERRPEFEQVLRERVHVPLPFPSRAPLEKRPHLLFDRLDSLLERGAVTVLLELLPGLEDVPGDLEAVEAEGLLGAEAEVGVEGEVAAQVRPAHLPLFGVEAVVSAEPIRTDDTGERVADQSVKVRLAAVGCDPQQRRLLAEGAPKRARLAGEIPAGLVDVERASRTGPLEQLVVHRRQRLAGAGEDRVDRADRDRAAKQLLHQLDELAAGETIADGQGGDRRLQLGAEAAARYPGRQLGTDPAAAIGTADALQTMLADLDRKRRQLRHLAPRRRTSRLALIVAEDVAAAAALRPVLDDLRHPLDRKQRPPVPRMARLAAPLPPRPPRAAPLPQPGRVVARRQRRIARIALQPLLKLLDPLSQLRELRLLRLQPRRQPEQRIDHRLTPLRIDRLRLQALHTRSFATPKRVPAD